ncbi:cytochrome P450 [Hypoxylon fragiforme]|uniref:cytochrome P450 n=1 Tax=Hypoxylon fragiforme TaxID=63214 RepID=UPI0020C5B6BD|nr:cytochrome P450 [Hypoxylon fragiforme]KAI2605903.1 cytochrome P450 [Hypoxylon fragiforme]
MDIISKIALGQELECVANPYFHNEFSSHLEASFKIGWTVTAFPMLFFSAFALRVPSATSFILFPLPITILKRTQESAPSIHSGARIPVIDRLTDPNIVEGYVPPSLDELNGKLVMLLTTGNDTTSNDLIFGIYKICTSRMVQQRLTEELIKEFPSLDEEITYDHARKLPYLTATIKETLRLGNPLPGRLPRTVSAEGYSLHDNFLKPGVIIHTSAYVLNRQSLSTFSDRATRHSRSRYGVEGSHSSSLPKEILGEY